MSFTYADGDVKALRDLNVRIDAGEFVCIVGANGSGKSTLARLLNGLLLPTTGTVTIEGRPTNDAAALWAIRRQIGIVFQNPDNQFVGATVEDDIAFGPENFGVDATEIGRRVHEALSVVGMVAHRNKPPHLLSGGQKQLVAIAGVLAQGPACVVLDEATAMLDPRGRGLVLQTATQLARNHGVTVIHITHHMDETLHADRIIALDEGSIAFDGTPGRLLQESQLLERLGLELPPVVTIADGLAQRGLDVSPVCTDVDELVEQLCRLA